METLVNENPVVETENTSFFDSKEHYLKFRQAWKQYIADGKHERPIHTSLRGRKYKGKSSLTCIHHLVYNALRKRDLHKSFSPLTNEGRLNAGYPRGKYRAFEYAVHRLKFCVRYNRTDWIKEPFGYTVTDEMLERLVSYLENIEL